jgi:hypothetical protein
MDIVGLDFNRTTLLEFGAPIKRSTKYKILQLKEIFFKKEKLNSGSQHFHQYQKNEQPPLTSTL